MTRVPVPPFFPRLLALDMDGTVLDPHHRITERTAAALEAWVDAGYAFVIATGRHYRDMVPYLNFIAGDGPMVLDNGGTLWNRKENNFVYHDPMPIQLVREVAQYAGRLDAAVFVSINTGQVLAEFGHSQFGKSFCDEYRIFQHVEEGALDYLEKNPHCEPFKMSCVGLNTNLQKIKDFVANLEVSTSTIHHHPELKPKALKSAFGLPQLLDVQPVTLSKATGLKKICSKFGISAHEVIAVGDGMNDEEMIRWAGFSYAMGNANPLLMDIACAELPSNEYDGVAQLIEYLLRQYPP